MKTKKAETSAEVKFRFKFKIGNSTVLKAVTHIVAAAVATTLLHFVATVNLDCSRDHCWFQFQGHAEVSRQLDTRQLGRDISI
jgi:hypothetical protein